ncbi:MAG TPA: hypothetical protein DEO85_11225 [Maritimibacter sp.]|nr:hypothetical protein [Maritimibacter sp.]
MAAYLRRITQDASASLALWFLISSLTLFVLGRVIVNAEHVHAEQQFRAIADANLSAIEDRMKRYDVALSGLAGLAAEGEPLTNNQYRAFANSLVLDGALPGVSGIGFVKPVTRSNFADFVDETRRDGLPGFTIKADSDHTESFIIRHMEPLQSNLPAVGLDITFEERRRSAALRARETGQTTLSPEILLVHDDTHAPGFILFHPVFTTPADEADLRSPTDSKGEFRGWVVATFVGSDALSDITRRQSGLFTVTVFDSTEADPEALVFTNGQEVTGDPRFTHTASLDLYGQTWFIRWDSRPEFEALQETETGAMLIFAAIILVFAPITAMGILAIRKQRLDQLVSQRTEELQTQSSLTASLLEDELMFVFVFDDQGTCILTNDAADQVLRRAAVARDTQAFFDSLHRATEPGARSVIGVDWNDDGEERVLSVSRHDWHTSAGEPRTTFISQDITTELDAVQKSTESENRLNLALRVSDVGVYDLDLTTGGSIVSDVWKKIMRVPEDAEIENFQTYFKERVFPEDLDVLRQNNRACIKGEVDRSVTEFRVKINGGTLWMQTEAIVSERAPDGTALRLVGTQCDITERKKLETAKSDFIATVSHELRTPITSVKGAVQLLAHKVAGSEVKGTEKLIDIANSNIEQLIFLINDILDFEQLASNRMPFNAGRISVSELLEDAEASLLPYATSTGTRLRLDPAQDDAVITGDRARVLQVLTNLVSNACKFSPEDTEVELGYRVENGTCRIYVHDQGPGIPADFERDLFQPFSQADRSDNRRHGGTGLGLAISQRFVEQMGGRIGYRRIADETSEFWIEFDIVSVDPAQPAQEYA